MTAETLQENGAGTAPRSVFFDTPPEAIISSLITQSRTEQRLARQRAAEDLDIDGTDLSTQQWVEAFCRAGVRFTNRNVQWPAINNLARLFDALVVTSRGSLTREGLEGVKYVSSSQVGGVKPSLESYGWSYDVVLVDNFNRQPLTSKFILDLSRQCHRHETFVIINVE